LFDLEADPYELDNLCDREPEIRVALRDRLLALLARTREPYFDVLIEHGVTAEGPVTNVADPAHGLASAAEKGGVGWRGSENG
jgi:hypothetical protein